MLAETYTNLYTTISPGHEGHLHVTNTNILTWKQGNMATVVIFVKEPNSSVELHSVFGSRLFRLNHKSREDFRR